MKGGKDLYWKVAVCVVILVTSCMVRWEIPDSRAKYSKTPEKGELRVPDVLLENDATRDLAINCAKLANAVATESSQNHAWSLLFGALQVAGVGVGTVATQRAFSGDDPEDASKRIAAISLGVAAAATAIDKAKDPGAASSRQAAASFRIGALLLQATMLLTTQPKNAVALATTALTQCQDPKEVNPAVAHIDLDALTKSIQDTLEQLNARKSRDGGVADGGPRG
jgi:hypothetical protein